MNSEDGHVSRVEREMSLGELLQSGISEMQITTHSSKEFTLRTQREKFGPFKNL